MDKKNIRLNGKLLKEARKRCEQSGFSPQFELGEFIRQELKKLWKIK